MYSSISLYASDILFLNLTYVSVGDSIAPCCCCNLINEFVCANSIIDLGLTFDNASTETSVSNWNKSIISLFPTNSHVFSVSYCNVIGFMYLLYVSFNVFSGFIILSSIRKSNVFLILVNAFVVSISYLIFPYSSESCKSH